MTVVTTLSPANQVKTYEWLTRVRGSLPALGLEDRDLRFLQEAFDRPKMAKYESLSLLGLLASSVDGPDKIRTITALMILDGTFVVQEITELGEPAVRIRYEETGCLEK